MTDPTSRAGAPVPPAAGQAPTTVSETPREESLNVDSMKVLLDLAVRRHDLAERSYDALNTRLAALFAFNSFLVPAAVASLRAQVTIAVGPAAAVCWRWSLFALWAGALVITSGACLRGHLARQIKTLPDPTGLHRDYATKAAPELIEQILSNLGAAWQTLQDAMKFKAKCLNAALVGVGVQVVALLTMVALTL